MKKLLFIVMTLFTGLFTTQSYADVTVTVGGSGANYSTLKAAFDDINSGIVKTGVITIQLTGNTYETVAVVLNANGVSAASYSYVNIYPTSSGLTIMGNLSSSMITFNGADYVTLDGRVHAKDGSLKGTTRDMTIINSGGSDLTQAYTISLTSDAQHNTIEYCTVEGSGTNANMGTIAFTTSSTAVGGNGYNTISNNLITCASGDARPYNCIYSGGGSGPANTGNIITNNEFADFMMPDRISRGIYLNGSANAGWTISGNSFYEDAGVSTTASFTFYCIQITGGTGYTISGNYMGGSTTLCGGSPWTKTGNDNTFIGIALTLTAGEPASIVQGNTIQNFDWTNSGIAAWTGINIAAGNVNNTGNTIGTNDGTTESITYTAGATGGGLNGFSIQSPGTINMQNNTIGSITGGNAVAGATNIYGVNISSAVTGTVTFNNNIINNIIASSPSTGTAQIICGIIDNANGNITISGNTIANLNNATTHLNAGITGYLVAIKVVSGTYVITNNIVHDLTIGNANNTGPVSNSLSGIMLYGSTAATNGTGVRTVTGNTIYNLYNTYSSFAGYICGIIFYGLTSGNTVDHNFIYNLGVTGATSVAAKVYGIRATGYAGNTTTYSDNIITLGGNTAITIYGIYETGAANVNNNLYFNTVYIGGSLTSGSTNKSYCLNSSASTNIRDFRNNIFMNARSTTSGVDSLHYAAWFNYAVSTNLTLDYNDYYVSGTGGMLGNYGYVPGPPIVPGIDVTSVPLIAGLDAASLAINPTFANAGGTLAVDYKPSPTVALSGIAGTGVTTDYLGFTRPDTPKIGAFETLTSEVNNVEMTNAIIIRNASGIIVPLNGESTIALYTISGMLIEKTKANGTYSRNLNNGMYIICINGKASRFIK